MGAVACLSAEGWALWVHGGLSALLRGHRGYSTVGEAFENVPTVIRFSQFKSHVVAWWSARWHPCRCANLGPSGGIVLWA